MTKPTGQEVVTQILPYIDEKIRSGDLRRLYNCIESAMDKYAKQEAIEFLNFTKSVDDNDEGYEYTNDQLYELYLQSKGK